MNILEIVLLIGLCMPVILAVIWICNELIDSINKNEDGYNVYNSSAHVQCNAKDKCDWRHSSNCASCGHNCGARKEKTSYIPR